MVNNRLLAPSITLNTTCPHQDFANPDSEAVTSTPLVTTDSSYLSVRAPVSPAATSLDGETLRSRSDSFLSSTETTRIRANSDAGTAKTKYESEEVTAEEALRPDNGTEKDFAVENNPFAFSPGQLNKLLNPKSLPAFKALGGVRSLERGLRTDLVAGLGVDETSLHSKVTFEEAITSTNPSPRLEHEPLPTPVAPTSDQQVRDRYIDRIRVFRDNRLPAKKPTSIWKLLWKAYKDKILILLTVAAVISLALGLYETFGQPRAPGETLPLDWVEGVAICVAIFIVVIVTAINDYQKEKQFVKLNKKKDDREVKAIRSGRSVMISVFDITAGDVLHLEPGDAIPADGIFISGHGVKCDESSATGESDQMRKTPGDEVWKHLVEGTVTPKMDPFLISGSKVLEGVGTYVVTSVGVNSSFGKTMMSLQTDLEDTPLQVKLAGLADWIGYLGTGAAGLLFFILLFRFVASLSGNTDSAAVKGSTFLDILIVAITIIVVAVPEGLPLAVTLALAFATFRMLKEQNLVRHLRACETMGNATTICSDKTGTLTQNKMTVVAGNLGSKASFAQSQSVGVQGNDEVLGFSSAFERLSPVVKSILVQSVAINSTAFDGEEDGAATFIGSKTETALLLLAKDYLGMGPVAEERSAVDIIQMIPFDSSRKCMGAVIRLPSGSYRVLVKGAAEILVAKATRELADVSSKTLQEQDLSKSAKVTASAMINIYAEKSLRTIGMLYKDFGQWPPAGVRTLDEDPKMANFEDIFHDMTLLGVVGIQDPLRPGVAIAVKRCQDAGVKVRMVTGDNAITASAIAIECGIKTEDGIVMEGPKFRQLSDADMDEVLPRLQVLARSSPEDKRILVQRLKHLGETVAVTGDGTNDGPALKMADVGFSMGIAGTEVAKEASAIILMDDNFSSIVTAIKWGRAVNDAVSKFLQFQITVNITAVLLAFISAVSSPDMHSVLTAVQLLWVNLIMDTFAALALATDAPTEKILDREPTPKRAPLITTNMWKMIVGQAIYQLVVTLVLYFAGASILKYDFVAHPELQSQLNTMVFNTFVWMQIFNEFNNRRLDNKFNIFEGVHRNWFFIGINAVMIGGQIMIVFVGGKAFQITRIDGTQWAICLVCALFCLPWAIVLRCIPDKYAKAVFDFIGKIFMAVLLPVLNVLAVVFRPVAKVWHAVFAPMKRFSHRMLSRMMWWRKKKEDVAATKEDEEAAEKTSETAPRTPPSNLPPITLTRMD
ncbi:MAG: plasma membrane calcium [Pleopsidium flavum]|nr:MAG: plasma membrane calcium [Pleopsidium flavum]